MPTTLDRLQYGFDRDSRRSWRRRALTTGEDDAYRYDGLSQVLQDARGNLNLNQTAIAAVPASVERFDYDPTGNWRGYETEAGGSVILAQHRVHDKGNRLTQIEGDPSPILLDRAGRMRQLPCANDGGGQNCTGWACNRLADVGLKPPIPPGTPYASPNLQGVIVNGWK